MCGLSQCIDGQRSAICLSNVSHLYLRKAITSFYFTNYVISPASFHSWRKLCEFDLLLSTEDTVSKAYGKLTPKIGSKGCRTIVESQSEKKLWGLSQVSFRWYAVRRLIRARFHLVTRRVYYAADSSGIYDPTNSLNASGKSMLPWIKWNCAPRFTRERLTDYIGRTYRQLRDLVTELITTILQAFQNSDGISMRINQPTDYPTHDTTPHDSKKLVCDHMRQNKLNTSPNIPQL